MDFSKLRVIGLCLLLGALALGRPAEAQTSLTPRDHIIASLVNQGYTVTQVRKTWLGRVQIRAISGDLQREVVLNPKTGEVLRDYIETVGKVARDDRSGGANRYGDDDNNSGPGSDDDDDDADDDNSSDDDSSDDSSDDKGGDDD